MITRILSALGYEKRASSFTYDPSYLPGTWGRAVTPYTSASAAAVLSNLAVAHRCTSIRSELLASVTPKLYRKLRDGDRELVTDTPLALALSDLANPLMTAYENIEFLVRQHDTTGNGFARLVRDGNGEVTEIWPINSALVSIERLESGMLRYQVAGQDLQRPMTLLQGEVLHIRASSDDGLYGKSPIQRAQAALGRAIAENQTAATLAANSFRISGVVTVPNARIDPKSKRALEDSFTEEHSTPDRVGGVKVLEGGAKFMPTAFSSADAEFLNSRRISELDVARIFGVPPASVGIESSVSYNSAQQAAADLVQNCLQPLAERVEQALMRCLLTPEGRRNYEIEFDLRRLVRGNMAERFAAYRIGREVGAYSVNDIRRMEGERTIEGGDTYLQPATLAGGTPITETNE